MKQTFNPFTFLNCIRKGNLSFFIWIPKVIFTLSGIAMTVLLCTTGSLFSFTASIFVSLITFYFIAFKYDFLIKTFANTYIWLRIFSAVLSLLTLKKITNDYYILRYNFLRDIFKAIGIDTSLHLVLIKITITLFGIGALFAIFVFMLFFTKILFSMSKDIFLNSDAIEKGYLLIFGVLFFICITIIYSKTNVFYEPFADGVRYTYNVIFTSDTGKIVSSDAYMNVFAIENDIRQPLFGLFSMPFALSAKTVSTLLFFAPTAYPIILNIIQIFLLLSAFIMITRLLQVCGYAKILVLCILTFCYPTLIFCFNMEQYIFTVFWLILFIYVCICKSYSDDIYFIAAAGSLLTSSSLFFLLSFKKNIFLRIKNYLIVALKFFATICIFGQLHLLLNAIVYLSSLINFVGTDLLFYEKYLQFINFSAMLLFKPKISATITEIGYYAYRLAPVTEFNYIGIVILMLALAGFIYNRKNIFAQICFYWVCFSFLLLCVVGWGTSENGLILYSLYFSWAYISLIILYIEKVFTSLKYMRYTLYCIIFAILLYLNLPAMYEIVQFGIKYYPLRG